MVMKKATPRLELFPPERQALRKLRIPLRALHTVSPGALAEETSIPRERWEELVTLSLFQTLGSVGPESARDLWALGYRSLDQLRGADPSQMYRRFEGMVGRSVDPCVEDVFRCAVAQALDPELPPERRLWWNWSDQRGRSDVGLEPVQPESRSNSGREDRRGSAATPAAR